jgi:hypothetical protein
LTPDNKKDDPELVLRDIPGPDDPVRLDALIENALHGHPSKNRILGCNPNPNVVDCCWNIPIALIDAQEGEQAAQTSANGCLDN